MSYVIRPKYVVASLLLTLSACAQPGPSVPCRPLATSSAATPVAQKPTASTTPTTGFPDSEARLRLFDQLVGDIRRLHVFTPQTEVNLGMRWDAELPELRSEMEHAESPTDFSVALTHLATSLHNPHVYYNAPTRPKTVNVGVELEMEWIDGAPRFYVSKITTPPEHGKLLVGDIIEEADGIEAAELVKRHSLESAANQWRGIGHAVARYLGTRRTGVSRVTVGERSHWRVRSRSGEKREVDLVWKLDNGESEEGLEYRVDYDTESCAGFPDRSYGPKYQIVARAQTACVYVSSDPAWKPYPVVRHFSFDYGASSMSLMHEAVRADHDTVKAAVQAISGVRGVIVDLRENKGGNNPNWMLDWYASGPYVDRFVRTKLGPPGDDEHIVSLLEIGGAKSDLYKKALKERAAGDLLSPPRPFFCRPDGCEWDNRYEPKHRITTAPIALLVGPGCVSSCDAVSQIFEENGFGPLIGVPTAAAYTTQRLRWPVKLPSGEDFGFFKLAFTVEESGKTHQSVEAIPLHMNRQIERTFENADKYDRMLVEAAREELTHKK